jgi:hypothetical protein
MRCSYLGMLGSTKNPTLRTLALASHNALDVLLHMHHIQFIGSVGSMTAAGLTLVSIIRTRT